VSGHRDVLHELPLPVRALAEMLEPAERVRLVRRGRDPSFQGVGGGHVGAGLVAEVLEDSQRVLVGPALLRPALGLLARRVGARAAAAAVTVTVPLQLR